MLQRVTYATGMVLLLCGACLAGEAKPDVEIRLETIKSEYLLGEPVILRENINTAGLPKQVVEWVWNRTLERLHLERSDGYEFPPLRTVETSGGRRDRSGKGFEDVVVLQPSECWPTLPGVKRLPEWTPEFMRPGEYKAHVTQILGEYPDRWTVHSNTVAFKIVEPTGRDLEAWNVIKADPLLLRMRPGENRFPREFEPRPTSYTAVDRKPEALERNVEFAKEYLDTAYGQFAVVHCALAGLTRGRFDVTVDLYPTLGRLIELRPRQDFLTQYARFLYLDLEIGFEASYAPEVYLARLREFRDSLTSPPESLLYLVDDYITGHQERITIRESTNWKLIEDQAKRLIDRDELPSDPAVRERRVNIALGRMDAP